MAEVTDVWAQGSPLYIHDGSEGDPTGDEISYGLPSNKVVADHATNPDNVEGGWVELQVLYKAKVNKWVSLFGTINPGTAFRWQLDRLWFEAADGSEHDLPFVPINREQTDTFEFRQPRINRTVEGKLFRDVWETHGGVGSGDLNLYLNMRFFVQRWNVDTTGDEAEQRTELSGLGFETIPLDDMDYASIVDDITTTTPTFTGNNASPTYILEVDQQTSTPRKLAITITRDSDNAVVFDGVAYPENGDLELTVSPPLRPELHAWSGVLYFDPYIDEMRTYTEGPTAIGPWPPGPGPGSNAWFPTGVLTADRHGITIDYDHATETTYPDAVAFERSLDGGTTWEYVDIEPGDIDYPPLNTPLLYRAWHDGVTYSSTVLSLNVTSDHWVLTDTDTGESVELPVNSVRKSREATTERATNRHRSAVIVGHVADPNFKMRAYALTEADETKLLTMLENSNGVLLRGVHGQSSRVWPTGTIDVVYEEAVTETKDQDGRGALASTRYLATVSTDLIS